MSNEKAVSSKNKGLTEKIKNAGMVSHGTPALSDSAAMMQMIGQAATDPAVDMDKMERLWGMKKEMDANDAEKAFNVAMSKAQSKTTRVAADCNNGQTNSKYASYAALDKALRPIYTKEGFSLSFDTGDVVIENSVRVLCYVSHKSGHTRMYHADIDASGKGAKGGDVMTKTHAAGSAMSYGMRYLLKMIFNVAIGEDDDDGNAATEIPLTITDEQATYLHALMTDNDLNTDHIMAWLESDIGCKTFGELYVNNFAVVERTIKAAITAKGAPS